MSTLKPVRCSICGNIIFRQKYRKKVICFDCRKLLKPYSTDLEYRQSVINRAKKRYREKQKFKYKLTPEEAALFREMGAYPVMRPGWSGDLGTSGPTANVKIVIVNGKERVKGAVYLEEWRKRRKS